MASVEPPTARLLQALDQATGDDDVQVLADAARHYLQTSAAAEWACFDVAKVPREQLAVTVDALTHVYLTSPEHLHVRGDRAARLRKLCPTAQATACAAPLDPLTLGGEQGLTLAQEHFCFDTALGLSQPALTYDAELSLRLLLDLVEAVVGDRWEAWDVWARLEEQTRDWATTAAEQSHATAVVEQARRSPASPLAQPTLERVRQGHRRLVERYQLALTHDALLVGMRAILPQLALAHWRRWGFEPASQRALIIAVEESFNPRPAHARRPPLPPRAEPDNALGVLTRQLRGFGSAANVALCAAARRYEHCQRDTWIQCTLQLPRAGIDALIAEHLGPFLRMALDAGPLRECYFMRKPPGLRLRLRGVDLRRRLLPELRTLAERVQLPLTVGPYDAERFQFGGHRGLDIAHQLFMHDSLTTCAWHALAADERSDPLVVSALLCNALVSAAVDSPVAEREVWRNMTLTGRLRDATYAQQHGYQAEVQANQPLFRALHEQPETFVESMEPAERALLEVACARFRDAGLALAASRSQLSVQVESVLPFLIIFHWNRFGLPLEDHVAISYSMAALLGAPPLASWR